MRRIKVLSVTGDENSEADGDGTNIQVGCWIETTCNTTDFKYPTNDNWLVEMVDIFIRDGLLDEEDRSDSSMGSKDSLLRTWGLSLYHRIRLLKLTPLPALRILYQYRLKFEISYLFTVSGIESSIYRVSLILKNCDFYWTHFAADVL